MSDSFVKALEFALRWEGGYSNHPADKGGETNFGVTHAVYDAYRKTHGLSVQSVRKITSAEVRDIYKKRYWAVVGCDLLSEKLAVAHFDWAVNAGVSRAIKTLQAVVGVNADGIIGPLTKQAIIAAASTHEEALLCDRYNAVREGCYRRWGRGSQAVFLQGWMNRLNALRRELKS